MVNILFKFERQIIAVNDTLPLIVFKVFFTSYTTVPLFLLLFKAVLEVPFWFFTVNAAAKCHPSERETCKNTAVHPHTPCSPDLEPWDFRYFLKVKMTLKMKGFSSIEKAWQSWQQIKDTKRTSRTSLESGKNNRISVFEEVQVFWGESVVICLLLCFFLFKHTLHFYHILYILSLYIQWHCLIVLFSHFYYHWMFVYLFAFLSLLIFKIFTRT